jgi:hypothetical protein
VQVRSISWAAAQGWAPPLPGELDSTSTLVAAFAAPQLGGQAAPLADLGAAFPRSRVVGCSTAGEILGDTLRDDTVTVSVARFDRTRVETTTAAVAGSADSAPAGQRVAAALDAPDLRAVFVLSDGLLVNGSELVDGITGSVPPGVVVTGGLAGDGERFAHTWVLAGGAPTEGAVSAVGLYGDAVRVGAGSYGGWDMFGPERRITRAERNVLYELDDRPALALYKEYLGDRARALPAAAMRFPLAVRAGRGTERRTVRTILAVDEQHQSMTFAGDLPVGWLAQLMRANQDRLVDGAMQAAAMSAPPPRTGPQLSVAISCVGRRVVLGERTEEEIEATREALPAQAQLVGFYSYGEIAPHDGGASDLHNQTMTVTTIGEG